MAHLIVPVNAKDHRQGQPNAPVILVEYGDYQCRLCRDAFFIIKQLEKELNHQLLFVFRHFPLQKSHPYAFRAAQAAEAAGLQNKFWEMHALLYKNQEQLNPTIFSQFAQQLQLNLQKFEEDFSSPLIIKKIEEGFSMGVRSGVNGIPCFFINSQRYDQDPSYNAFRQALIQSNTQ